MSRISLFFAKIPGMMCSIQKIPYFFVPGRFGIQSMIMYLIKITGIGWKSDPGEAVRC